MKINLNENENDGCYSLQFYKTRKKISNIIENALFALEEEIKINNEKVYLKKLKTQNNYKKIKKNLFSFTGLWSNKDIFYNSDNDKKEGNEIEEDINNTNTIV